MVFVVAAPFLEYQLLLWSLLLLACLLLPTSLQDSIAASIVLGSFWKYKHDVEVRTGTRIVENQALITNSVS